MNTHPSRTLVISVFGLFYIYVVIQHFIQNVELPRKTRKTKENRTKGTMGLASSQARLLNLTARLHQIEYKSQKLEAQKLQMANESTHVYEDYLNALDATKIQYNILSTDGSTTYIDATYNNLIAAGYKLKFANEKVQVTQETIDNYEFADGNKDLFVALETGRVTVAADGISTVDSEGTYEVYNASQLMVMSGSSGTYRLMSDITITEDDNWSGITDFGGTFDGNGHTVTIESGTNGLFANTISGATISNVNVVANVDSTSVGVGALIGSAVGTTVDNCSVSGTVTSSEHNVGGAIGDASNCTISNSTSNCTVNCTRESLGETYVGGFVGQDKNSTYNNCIAAGTVNNVGTYTGGFVGLIGGGSTSTFENCSTSVDVYASSSDKCGTFGSTYNAMVNLSNCEATGSIYYGISTLNTFFYNARGTTNNSGGSSSATGAKTSTEYTVYGSNDASEAKALFEDMQEYGYILIREVEDYGWADGWQDSNTWLTNMVNMGELYIYQYNSSTGKYEQTSVSTNTGLQEVSDEVALKKAEAKYEADMKKIDLKDRRYDTDLAAVETEREAIVDEIDTLKTVAKDNVDRTFKLFS